MTKPAKLKKYLYDITPSSALQELNTTVLFSENYTESTLSPIDQFIENTNHINVIWSQQTEAMSEALSSLVLLGYMSAVESYLRALFRGIINIDEVARKKVETRSVTFAAAIHHTIPLMPEALLESISLSSEKNILESMRDLLGIASVQDKDFVRALEEFSKIVEIRHCCVHRFGKLGSQNAQKLGLSEHSILFEKPFRPDFDNLAQVSASLRSIVHTINSTIFKKLMERVASKDNQYSFRMIWNFTTDKKNFRPYYDLFSSSNAGVSSPTLKEAYDKFRDVYKS